MENNADFYKKVLDNIYDGVYFVNRKREITFWNRGAERITGYKASEVMGHICSENILMHMDDRGNSLCMGLCPLVKAINNEAYYEQQIYLKHKNGYRIPIVVKVMPMKDEYGEIAGAVEVFSDNSQLKEMTEKMKKLAKMAFYDDITELANRRYTEMKLASLLGMIKKEYFDIGVLAIDIDYADKNRINLKLSNEILKAVAKTILANIQTTDVACRWEANRILVICEHARKSIMLLLADKLRTLILNTNLRDGSDYDKLTVSIGGTIAIKNDSVSGLIQRAMQNAAAAGNTLDNSIKFD